jgi:hypothetical protein
MGAVFRKLLTFLRKCANMLVERTCPGIFGAAPFPGA